MKLWFAFCTALLLCILVVAADPEPAPGPAFMSTANAASGSAVGADEHQAITQPATTAR